MKIMKMKNKGYNICCHITALCSKAAISLFNLSHVFASSQAAQVEDHQEDKELVVQYIFCHITAFCFKDARNKIFNTIYKVTIQPLTCFSFITGYEKGR